MTGPLLPTLVVITCYDKPEFVLDSAAAFERHHADCRDQFRVVFAVDNSRACADALRAARGEEVVYCSPEKNGWGRGVLRTCLGAFEHFSSRIPFRDAVTMDDDTLTTGEFLDEFHSTQHLANRHGRPRVAFVGTVANIYHAHARYVRHLHEAGFCAHRPFDPARELVFGACMLWTDDCFRLLRDVGLLPLAAFDRVYPDVFFTHDLLSTFFASVGLGGFANAFNLGQVRWQSPLPADRMPGYGMVPVVPAGTRYIHPLRTGSYDEARTRAYYAAKPVRSKTRKKTF